MTSLVPRPSTNGTSRSSGGSQSGTTVQPSFSSFPSRTTSIRSLQNGMSMSGQLRPQNNRAGSIASSQSQQQSSVGSPPVLREVPERSTRRRLQKLKPQYPKDSPERHVEYILVANFDIDRGPTMEHQYPGPISGDEHMLAELMMPDQTHMRSEDWTIFFLHKDSGEQEEERQAQREAKRQQMESRRRARAEALAEGVEDGFDGEEDSSEDDESDDDEGGQGPPLIYVLNLVNTKKLENPRDNRGALVKAMAICTRHPFLHIYKPLLLLALGDYFKNPTFETLGSLYESVNAMDLSLLPRFTTFERRLLLMTDKKNLFIEKFEHMIQQSLGDTRDGETDVAKVPQRPNVPRDTRDFDSRVIYNQIPIPVKIPSAIAPETVGDFSFIKLIQTFSNPHATSPQPFALHPHLTPNGAYTHPILVLINAVLTQKRVIFLGHQRPSGEVAEAVLAACALCSGTILRGFTRHAFPYTDLTKIDDLLNVPGFIAGVTNSIFANHLEWWDLLCDVSTGRMKISSKIEPALPTEGLASFQQAHPQYAPSNSGVLPGNASSNNDPKIADPTGDIAFIEDIQRSIAARHGEHAIRSKWHGYIARFLRLASAFEETVFEASALDIGAAEADAGELGVSGHGCVWPDETTRVRELAAAAWRIEGWRNTRSYYALVQDIAALWSRQPVRKVDLAHQLDRLRLLKLPRDESGRIFIALRDAVKSYDEICQLLAAAPESQASIFYIGLGLFHPDKDVREATAVLLERIKEHEVGRHYWPQLGRFSRVALMRIQREMQEAAVED